MEFSSSEDEFDLSLSNSLMQMIVQLNE